MCGAKENLQAHHIDQNPKNNTSGNIMTLCAGCHTRLHWAQGKTVCQRRTLASGRTNL
ncbi:HNH endonuclease [Acutalibacter sp. 1XD8-33]|uniref:HNH endonuclease n=1 Tax=Acutalibacter sp. 1XD8-33 TaxID=2320081 RepID=UPI003FA4C733